MTTSPTPEWKLGEACFIAVADITPQRVRLQVMPAMVTNPRARTAQALNPPSTFGPTAETGQPFRTEEEARAWIQQYVERVVEASKNIPLVGSPFRWHVPEGMPDYGDIVYYINAEAKEVLEVAIGFLSVEDGRAQVGYDPSPSNPEASCIGITEWCTTKEDALEVARAQYGAEFTFISKEDVAVRTDQALNSVFRGPPSGWSRDILPEHPAD